MEFRRRSSRFLKLKMKRFETFEEFEHRTLRALERALNFEIKNKKSSDGGNLQVTIKITRDTNLL